MRSISTWKGSGAPPSGKGAGEGARAREKGQVRHGGRGWVRARAREGREGAKARDRGRVRPCGAPQSQTCGGGWKQSAVEVGGATAAVGSRSCHPPRMSNRFRPTLQPAFETGLATSL